MNQLHSLLRRQLQRHIGPDLRMSDIPMPWLALIRDVDAAYRESDSDREMLERSLDLSSQELVEANTEMRAVFRALPDLMLRMDRFATILDAKAGEATDSRLARREFVGKVIQDTPLRKVSHEFVRAIDEVLATGRQSHFEYSTAAPEREADFEVRLVPLPDRQVLAMVRDISERKRTERQNAALMDAVHGLNADLERRVVERTEALRQQNALFHAAADQAPQVIWIVNPQGAVTYLNRYWYELVGGAPPKWHGHEWMDAVLPQDVEDMKRNWKSVHEEGAVFAGMRRVRCVDGTLHTLYYRASPVYDADGNVSCWIGMDADVTELKAVERALRLSNRELEAFSYSVSHDLRAPLATIDGFCKVLEERLGSHEDERHRHYLSRIRFSVNRMGQLIDSLLALAQISRRRLTRGTVDLSELAAQAEAELRSGQGDREVRVSIEPGLTVQGDAGLLSIAIGNLMSNAWKFTSRRKDGQISVGRGATEDGEATFYVRDNGAGFDMEYKDKLFGTFQRLHSQDEFPGTGVGLATVKRIIGRHGGKVWADSAPGKGAVFHISLPQALPLQGDGLPGNRGESGFDALASG